MGINKLKPEEKDQLERMYPLMVGDIDPMEHKRRMEVINAVRDRIEAGEILVSEDPVAAVDAMLIEEEGKKPKPDKPPKPKDQVIPDIAPPTNTAVVVDTLPSETPV